MSNKQEGGAKSKEQEAIELSLQYGLYLKVMFDLELKNRVVINNGKILD